jgi:hypothetical protein
LTRKLILEIETTCWGGSLSVAWIEYRRLKGFRRPQSAGDIKTNFIVIALLFINTLSAADFTQPPELNPSHPNKKNILITKKKIKQ